MCLTTALAVAGIGLKIAEGMQAQQAANANARIAEQEARLARQDAEANAIRHLEAGDEKRGEYLARTGASNVELSRGSPVEVSAEIKRKAHRDFLMALHGGDVEAWGHNVRATQYRNEGRAAFEQSILGAGMSLLGMAARQPLGGGGAYGSSAGKGGFFVPYG